MSKSLRFFINPGPPGIGADMAENGEQTNTKVGARNSRMDQSALDTAHDALVMAGANCPGANGEPKSINKDGKMKPENKSVQRCAELCRACVAACVSCVRQCTSCPNAASAEHQACIAACKDCMAACELCVAACESGNLEEIEACCQACITACDACAKACGDCAAMCPECKSVCTFCASCCEQCASECRILCGEEMSEGYEMMSAEKTLVSFGGEVKALGDGKVGGYLVRFSTPSDPDLEGDFFTKNTDFGDFKETDVYLHHRMPIKYKGRTFQFSDPIGKGKLSIDDVGVFMEAVIEMRGEYEEMVKEVYKDAFMKLVEDRQFGLSSGTAGHLVDREPVGKSWWIKKWPLALDASITPTPAEPRTGIVPLKSLYVSEKEASESQATADGNLSVTETKNTYTFTNVTNAGQPLPAKENKMAENEEGKVTPEFDYEKLADMVAKRLDAPGVAKSAPAVIHAENLGDPDPYRALANWARGGSAKGVNALGGKFLSENQISFGATKGALQEGDATEGGGLVRNDFYPQIVAKRDQQAIARRAGARVIQTSRDVVDIPYENASMANFAITAEEAAYTENEPTFGTVSVTVYKFTKLIKVSEELLDDDDTNLDAFLTDAIGRSWALTENEYTLVGTGTSQPQGVFAGGSVGYTFADTNSISASEVPALFWSLGSPYHDGAVWVADPATIGQLQGLTGNNFQLTPQTYAPNQLVGSGGDLPLQLWAKPIFISDSVANIATGNKTMMFGNWNYYGLVERRGLTVSRNPYLYQANGQVGIFVSVRFGGAVLQSEAFKWGIQA